MKLQLHDEGAYALVSNIIDGAERRLVRKALCVPEMAEHYLTMQYIEDCSAVITNSTQYLESDERIAADMFLAKIAFGALKSNYHSKRKICSTHLASQPWLHFPNYKPLLRIMLLNVLRNIQDVHELRYHGVALLACGVLENAVTDLRREFRRRGLSYDPTLITDATVDRRIGPNGLAPTETFVSEKPKRPPLTT